MIKRMSAACGLCMFAACASSPEPTEHLAASMAAVRGAETAGAASVPQAELHLKLAQEQVDNARQLMESDDNERADAMTIRAYNDAELAIALAREAQLKRQVEQYSAVTHSAPDAPSNAPADATNPPGVGAPNNPPSSRE